MFYTKKGPKKTPNVVSSFRKITEECYFQFPALKYTYIMRTPSVVVPTAKKRSFKYNSLGIVDPENIADISNERVKNVGNTSQTMLDS